MIKKADVVSNGTFSQGCIELKTFRKLLGFHHQCTATLNKLKLLSSRDVNLQKVPHSSKCPKQI
jgi:hypothetical protein